MSLQTSVFENGRWVTRSLDPYHVRAQNTRRDEGKTASSPTSPEKPPLVGLLTRTLARTSVTKWIIPARIRHKTKNDVLFVSADSVTIKEVSCNCALKNISVKNDFDSPIRAARILGDRRKYDQGDKYNAVYRKWPVRVGEGRNPDNAAYHLQELPPHILVLALESNQLVFMCAVDGPSSQAQLLSSQHQLPIARSPIERLGKDIAVDPKWVAVVLF